VDANWRKGVEYIHSQMNTVFEEYGVFEIGKVGEVFDPNIHESLEMVDTNEKDKNHTIANVIQKGYKIGGRVLRPARVNVFEFKE
jgi:molecular chaperone GrpE